MNETVLVVDDEPKIVKLAQDYLERSGFKVLTASAETGGARLTVADTGEGISPADLPYIFDRFWRGDRSRSHTHNPGSGLGLAITRQLIQAHGGQITVQSRPGQGSTFTILLPEK